MFNFNLTPTVRNLLLINLAVLLVQQNLRALPIDQWGSLYPLGSPYFHFWQFFTHMFMHSGWGHFFANMFGLISFGPLLEQRWGSQRFLAFWLMCGIGAGVFYEGVRTYELHQFEVSYAEVARNPDAGEFKQLMQKVGDQNLEDYAAGDALARNPSDRVLQQAVAQRAAELYNGVLTSPYAGMLGASGALFGVLFAFAYLFPNTELMLLFIPFPVKAVYLVFLYGMYELYAGIHQAAGDHVAHFAHIGGLLVGFIIIKFWESGRTRFY
jgi:membrane associated rhomboid family serine protease